MLEGTNYSNLTTRKSVAPLAWFTVTRELVINGHVYVVNVLNHPFFVTAFKDYDEFTAHLC